MGSEESTNAPGTAEAGVPDEIREFWDEDAATYDRSAAHYPQRPQEQAAWAAPRGHRVPVPAARRPWLPGDRRRLLARHARAAQGQGRRQGTHDKCRRDRRA